MKLTLPYPPSTNRYWRSDRGGRPHVSDEARQYKQTVGLLLLAAGLKPRTMGVSLAVAIYRPRRSGDLDNYLKVLLDALKGYAYVDDSQVVEIHARRHDDKEAPRVEVTITEAA